MVTIGDATRKKVLHVEPSTRCTIACPHCPRTMYLGDVSIHDCDIDMVVNACHGIDRLALCGNHGDPIYHPRFHDLISGVKTAHPDICIDINTNGAFRSADWWRKLALILDEKDELVFSIDGMPYNNHIYRVNSKWKHIEEAVTTVRSINKKVNMVWKWILFNYNEDEVLQGIRLAKKMGFNWFKVIGSTRDEDDDKLRASKTVQQIREEFIASGISKM